MNDAGKIAIILPVFPRHTCRTVLSFYQRAAVGCTDHPPAGIACPPTISAPLRGADVCYCFDRMGQIRVSGRLVNYGVKKSAVREREERRTV